ncbi:LPS export ABC transporter ATP-binding protein [Fusobacterium necrophorum]|uniref:ABC transporter ATP-binding protein n=1 Tax=Fusobacterium necrophorum BL TaxID=1441732 RepID=A0AB73BV57_9FUSO|nr:LPS export ABC transporter ATP-binding protein [Fusobacterium necrophorum]AYZ73336.1 LPS export ABC transporter ATP-binding protein [Fusobacterium necrophorum]AZW08666.1 LPS export ABC transporter ATP-binding protein [Fusobacterium necrophorum subsp. necrophorum]KDE62473.1 ABC transporter ATP-binding protein [Fusobacterium necrophorum BL]SDB21519.1 lipopolysaccharide export system ATP-binding protein [Fusobacterium necrophorum]SQD09610.1 Lipopolysaccharide export system ATP-binding protein 
MINLTARNLVKAYKQRKVVDSVSLEVNKGEIVGLLGPNGAGKTTTFYMITGIIKPNAGSVICNGQEITSYPMYKRANLGIGYLAQEPSVFRNLTVEDNIRAILEMKNYSKKTQKEIVAKLLEEFKLTHVYQSLGYSLSGGERRRVEIARTIANNPSFILLDEPFAGVDPIAVEDIQQSIRYLQKRGLGILITDHSVRETLNITEKAYIMAQGKVIISGSPQEIAENEMARKIYLGENFKLD